MMVCCESDIGSSSSPVLAAISSPAVLLSAMVALVSPHHSRPVHDAAFMYTGPGHSGLLRVASAVPRLPTVTRDVSRGGRVSCPAAVDRDPWRVPQGDRSGQLSRGH